MGWKTWLTLGHLLLSACAVAQAAVSENTSSQQWGQAYFPNTALVTQDGQPVRFFDDLIKDKVVAINFIFTTCTDSCPLETARLRQVQKLLGDRVGRDVFFYSISIDPETDTPEVLKQSRQKFHTCLLYRLWFYFQLMTFLYRFYLKDWGHRRCFPLR